MELEDKIAAFARDNKLDDQSIAGLRALYAETKVKPLWAHWTEEFKARVLEENAWQLAELERRLLIVCAEVADMNGSTRFAVGHENILIQTHYARYGKVTKSKRVDNPETLRNYIAALQFWQGRINQ